MNQEPELPEEGRKPVRRRRWWTFPFRVVGRFFKIGGSQYAAAFAFYALISLLPMVLLLVNLGSLFVDEEEASDWIIDTIGQNLPIGEEHRAGLMDRMEQMRASRGTVSLVAFLFVFYSASRLFKGLVKGTDDAWNCEVPSWWEFPVKNLSMILVLGSALLLGFIVPLGLKSVQGWIDADLASPFFNWLLLLLPTLILFYGLLWFYRIVPGKLGKLKYVWLPALGAAITLTLFQRFGLWITDLMVSDFYDPAIYGVMGVVMLFLYGTFISGCIILFGSCACAEIAGRE